jgi:hypothetical protein
MHTPDGHVVISAVHDADRGAPNTRISAFSFSGSTPSIKYKALCISRLHQRAKLPFRRNSARAMAGQVKQASIANVGQAFRWFFLAVPALPWGIQGLQLN